MSSARNADIKTAGVMMRTVCVVIGNVVVRALCDTEATFTMMSSLLAASVPKRAVGRRRLRIETPGDVLEGEFDVVEVTARGMKLANTFTFQAVVMDELSGIFERVEPESYQVLQEVVVVIQSLLISLVLVQTILVLCLEKIVMIPLYKV